MAMMTDPVAAKAALYDEIKDLQHAKCATSASTDATFDIRVAKKKKAGLDDATAVHKAYTDMMADCNRLRGRLSRT